MKMEEYKRIWKNHSCIIYYIQPVWTRGHAGHALFNPLYKKPFS